MSLSNIKLLKPLLYEVNSWSCQIHLSSRESSAVSTDPLTGQLISVIGRASAKHRSRNKNTRIYQPLKHARPAPSELLTPRSLGNTDTSPLTVLLFTLSNPQHTRKWGRVQQQSWRRNHDLYAIYHNRQTQRWFTDQRPRAAQLAWRRADVT